MAQGRIRAFLLGGILGAGAALLFAPRSGKDTRALLTDKAEEMWGEGADLYSHGFEKVKSEAANVQKTAAQANDELRTKIENARSAIAEQIAKNAQSARDTINAQMPIAGEKIAQTADVVKGQIENAANKIKSATANLAAKDAEAADAAAAAKEAAVASAEGAEKPADLKTAEGVIGDIKATAKDVNDAVIDAAKSVEEAAADAKEAE